MIRTAVLAGLLVAGPVQTPKPERAQHLLAGLVPKDAFFLVQAKGLDALRADFEAGAWCAFFRDEEMKGIRGWLEKEVARVQAEGQKSGDGLDVDPWTCLQSLHGSAAVFGVCPAGQKVPAIGVLVDPGEPRGAFDDILAKLSEHMKRTYMASTTEHEGVEIRMFEENPEKEEPTGGNGGLHQAAIFECDGATCILEADSREQLVPIAHGIIDRSRGKDPSNGIEGAEALAQARASVPKPGRVEAFLDLTVAIAMARADDPPDEEAEQVLRALGVDGLRWLYASSDVGKGESFSFDLTAKLPDRGYLRDWIELLGKAPREMAAMAPRESITISIAQFDLWGLWQSAWKLAAEIDDESTEEARSRMEESLAQVGAGDLEKRFLSQFDGRFLSFGIPVPEEEWRATLPGASDDPGSAPAGLATGTAFLLGLRDVQSVSSFVEAVLTAVGMMDAVKTEEFEGNRIYRFSAGPGPGIQWAFLKQSAVVSQFPTAIRAALRMEGAEMKDSVLEKEVFKPLFEAHAGAGILGLANTAENLKGSLVALTALKDVMSMGTMISGKGSGGSGDDPFQYLPTGAAIDRHFKGALVSTVSRAGGILRLQVSSR